MVRLLSVWVLLFVAAPAARAATACTSPWKMLMVGMVKDRPIVAEAKIIDSRPEVNGGPPQPFHAFAIEIARNSAGDVVIRMAGEHDGKLETWNTFHCDLDGETTYTFVNSGVHVWREMSIPGRMRVPRWAFQRPVVGPKEQVSELGKKEMDGVNVNGFRWPKPEEPDRVMEEWLSPDLFMAMLHIETNTSENTERRTVVTKVKREEPDAKLFEIPRETAP